MTLTAGRKLGPYEIISPIGAGGMGEVYRAKDARLAREVAIKVLPESMANDSEALARFEREAKAVAALSHPNILALHDIGHENGIAFAVMELLEGETLRARLNGGALAPRKALEYARQIAEGLAAAHDKGIIHRDLKPENLFLGKDDRLKILDFGLAKQLLTGPSAEPQENSPTRTLATGAGVILGTLGYMSPEQVRGEAVDARSDLFSFGVVFFEMLTGKKAFSRNTASDTLAAILRDDPPEIDEAGKPIPPALRRILEHCMEKVPARRFHTAHDLVFALEAAADASSHSSIGLAPSADVKPRRAWLRFGLLVLILPGLLGAWWMGHAGKSQPTFKRITFGKGSVDGARFVPGSQEVMFSARWNGLAPEIFSLHPDSLEPRSLGIQGATLLSIAPSGELVVKLDSRLLAGFEIGQLARVAPGGGKRVILDEAVDADWIPGGAELAVVHGGGALIAGSTGPVNPYTTLDFPAGHPLPGTGLFVWAARVSPQGDRLACFEQPAYSRGDGQLVLLDLQGKRRSLAPVQGFTGLAWGPGGKEIWFSEAREGSSSLWAISLSGRKRLLLRQAGLLELLDVAPDGRALAALGLVIKGVMGMNAPDFREKDVSWNEATAAQDISADGKSLLLSAGGDWSNMIATRAVYLHKSDGSMPVRLGDAIESHFMPNGRQILALSGNESTQFSLIPLGPGQPQALPLPRLDANQAYPLPDNKHVVVFLNNIASLMDLETGAGKPLAEAGVSTFLGARPVSPDGERVVMTKHVGRADGGVTMLYSTTGAAPIPVKGTEPRDITLGWSADGKSIFVFNRDGLPARIHRIELATGKRTLVREIMPANPGGMAGILSFVMTPDAQHLAYNYVRKLSDLYLIEGLK